MRQFKGKGNLVKESNIIFNQYNKKQNKENAKKFDEELKRQRELIKIHLSQ